MRTPLIAIPFIAALAACTPAEQAAFMALSESPTLDGGSFSTGGGISVAADVKQVGGQVALCGVWSESKRQSILTKGTARNVINSGAAYLGGEVLHRDLGFMRKVPPATSYAGQSAACVRTAQVWTDSIAGQQLTLRIPAQVVHREINDDGGANFIATFTQDGPGAFNPSLKSLILD